MVNNSTVEGISNIIAYNSYYVLFLTYVFPILLIILLIFIIVYLSSINKKLLMSFNKEKKIELLDDNDDSSNSKKQSKTLYELTLIPALICLSIFIIMFFVTLFSSL